jgi:hypothetical protein
MSKEQVPGSLRTNNLFLNPYAFLKGVIDLFSAGSNADRSQLPRINVLGFVLALLRWYGANTVTNITIGGAPNGIAFDGQNI